MEIILCLLWGMESLIRPVRTLPSHPHWPKMVATSILAFVVLAIFFTLKFQQGGAPKQVAAETISDAPVTKKVFLLVFNPIIESRGGEKLTSVQGWSDPDALTTSMMPIIKRSSHDFLTYTIAERQEIDGWPVKSDGFIYDDVSYMSCMSNNSTCHQPDIINYEKLFTDYNICNKDIDEVWLWGGPYFGYWEYNPVTYCGKTQFVMGFSYERDLGEVLHDFGHRMEFVNIERINKNTGKTWAQDEETEWNKFSKIDGHCGNVHNPPGAPEGYNYGKTDPVSTDCSGYLNYPEGPYVQETITCQAWGCSHEGFIEWWLTRVPHNSGINVDSKTGKTIYNNWWKYYAYFDETASEIPGGSPTPVPEFSNVSALFKIDQASFNFSFSGVSNGYIIDVSTLSDMSWDVYLSFSGGSQSPLVVADPQDKWDKYSCGRTLYWRVYNADRSVSSAIQATTVDCGVPTNTPTPTSTPTLTPTRTPTPSPTRAMTPTPTRVPTPTPTRDVQPPNIVITAPANNSTIPSVTMVTVNANASDASGISKVEFYVNNSLKCTDARANYSCRWLNIARKGAVYNLTAKAIDNKGNSATSSVVKIIVR